MIDSERPRLVSARPTKVGESGALPGPETINARLAGLDLSPTLALQARTQARIAQGAPTFRLGFGQSPFPVPASVVTALRAHAAEKDYLPVKGLRALREAVADYLARRHALIRSYEDVIVGPGSKELMWLLQVAFEGELLVPRPSWVSYAPQARIAGRQVRWIETRVEDGLRLDPELLRRTLAGLGRGPRILILNYPSNPVGHSYEAARVERIAAVAREHGLIVLSDEIYSELSFAGEHVSIARFYEEGTIIATGLSKWCGAGGWRLGVSSFPPGLRWLLDAVAILASETYSSTAAPVQHAAVPAFRGGADIEDYLTLNRRIMGALLGAAYEDLRAAGAEIVPPEGGFYVFPSLAELRAPLARRGIRDDSELAERLLEETGVATLPGEVFGMPADALRLRLALVDFDGARAQSAAASRATLDREYLELHCAPTMAAIASMCRWMTELS